MTSSDAQLLNTITVSDETDLIAFWGALLGPGGFGQRTLWLAVLDDEGKPVPITVPIDDLPRNPTTLPVDGLSTVIAGIAGYGTVIAMISRPGSPGVDRHDRSWAEVPALQGLRWPLCLGTVDGGRCVVRPIRGTG